MPTPEQVTRSGVAMVESLEGPVTSLNTRENQAFGKACTVVDKRHERAENIALAYTGIDPTTHLGVLLTRWLVDQSDYYEKGLTVERVRERARKAADGDYLATLNMFRAVNGEEMPFEYLAALLQ
jgi:hypothetical protein